MDDRHVERPSSRVSVGAACDLLRTDPRSGSDATPELHSRAAAERLRYRDFLTMVLIVKGNNPFSDNWIYIHDPSVLVGRVQNFRSWSPEMVPDPALSSLGLEYFCFEGDGLWTMPDSELIALAKREIAEIGLVASNAVIGPKLPHPSSTLPKRTYASRK